MEWPILCLSAFAILVGAGILLAIENGKNKERASQLEKNQDAVGKANDVKAGVDKLDDAAVADELSKWRR